MSMNDELSKIFDVNEPAPPAKYAEPQPPLEKIEDSDGRIDIDFDLSRDNLHELLMHGREALLHALDVAKQSEHPRAFEVVGNLMKQLADVNQQLMDLHKQKKTLSGSKEKSTKTVTNNSIFVGSTAELNKMLNDLKKGDT